ncbi:MAG: hypothetical protein ACKVZH_18915 [Blastocatellia bacterium]
MLAFCVAFLCEWSSAVAAIGFPFGLYYYINRTSDKELWISGVPVMDSLSFTFLSYVSWELATTLLGRLQVSWRDAQVLNADEVRRSWAVNFLAPFLMITWTSSLIRWRCSAIAGSWGKFITTL